MKSDHILSTAEGLMNGDRAKDYGSALESFTRIGVLWGAVTNGAPFPPAQVALMLVQLKVARIVTTPNHLDSWIDMAGYTALGAEIATSNANTQN